MTTSYATSTAPLTALGVTAEATLLTEKELSTGLARLLNFLDSSSARD